MLRLLPAACGRETAAVWRQQRGARTQVPISRIRLSAEQPEMIPSRFGRFQLKEKSETMSKQAKAQVKRRSISIMDPRTTKLRSRKPTRDLSRAEQSFVEKAHGDLAREGLGKEERLRAWMDDKHDVFPERVRQLDKNVRDAVKFGGLGITSQTEHLKERYLLARRQETDLQRQMEREQEEAASTGERLGDTAARARRRMQKRKLGPELEKLRQMKRGLARKARETLDPQDIKRARQEERDDDTARRFRSSVVNQEIALERHMHDVARMAEGKSPVSFQDVRTARRDLSKDMSTIARAVLVGVRTDGKFPIHIPMDFRNAYSRLIDPERAAALAGLSPKERGRLHTRERRMEAYADGKDALRTYQKSTEFGGVKNAREWRQQNPWDWKSGSEPKHWEPGDRYAPWTASLERSVGTEATARGMHKLMTEKQTSDKPPHPFYALYGAYYRRLNARYGSDGNINMDWRLNQPGPSAPGRQRAAFVRSSKGGRR